MGFRAIGGRDWRRSAMTLVLLSSLAASSNVLAVDLIGYLPWYRMSGSYNANTLPDQLVMLDEIRYFGLTVNSSGETVPLADSGTLTANKNRITAIRNLIATLPENQRPRLNITLGGAGEAGGFAAVAADETLRATLASNISNLLNETGATSVDIDWEHPSNAQNLAGAAERNNYSLMVRRIKEAVGPNRQVYATMTPEIFMPTSAFEGNHGIDGISLMTYDLGWWGNDPGNPHDREHSLPEYVEDSLDAWTEPTGSTNDRTWVFPKWGNNTAAYRLGVGLPFYGRGVISQQDYTYAEMVAGGTTTDGNYYNYAGQSVWIPGPELVEQRVEFARDNGLQNLIIWEIGQDLHPDNTNSLLRRAYDKNLSFLPVPGDFDGNGTVGAEDYGLWKWAWGSTSGDMRADGNDDGIVDAADYTLWRDRLTSTTGSGSAASASVPEPSTAILLSVLGAFAISLCRRWGTRSLA